MNPELYFVIPGDINTLTGGYAYDRELIHGLRNTGIRVQHMSLSGQFPAPDESAIADAARQLASIPDGALVMIDGLAYGVMDQIAQAEYQRLNIIALCHHPLAFESGLSSQRQSQLFKSERAALQVARAVLVTSQATARLLEKAFAVPAEKILVAIPGTRRQPFAPCRGQTPCLLTVATLTRRKAHDVLIDALSRITNLEWTARFVGGEEFDPDWAAFIRKRSELLRLQHRISFAGSISDLTDEYYNADMFVLPSRFEGYGMVFAEALSFGLPIVAARAGAVPDVVPEQAGILVTPDDATELAFTLHELLSDPAQYNSLRQGAQQAALQLPQWHDTAETVADLIHDIWRSEARHGTTT